MKQSLYKNLLVVDIETVSMVEDYNALNDKMKTLWDKKAAHIKNDDELTTDELFKKRAGIFAEYGKIIVIGAGFLAKDQDTPTLRVKAFADDDESVVLQSFKQLLEQKFDPQALRLVAHNGKEFDFPYICRRMLINGIGIPETLQISGKKPWEINHIDTMEMWKFGDYKNYTSLDTLAALFDIDSSKDDIDGSMVNEVYYSDNDLERIAHYCKKDVIVTTQLLLKLNGQDKVAPENIQIL